MIGEEGKTSGVSERHRAPEGVCLLPASLAASYWDAVLGIM